MSLPGDITSWLASQGYGTVGVDIFRDELPDQPDSQIAVFFNGGRSPVEDLGGGAVDYPAFTIQVRNTSKATARDKAEQIRQVLDAQTVGQMTIFTTLSFPVYLGKDDSNRYRYVVDFETINER